MFFVSDLQSFKKDSECTHCTSVVCKALNDTKNIVVLQKRAISRLFTSIDCRAMRYRENAIHYVERSLNQYQKSVHMQCTRVWLLMLMLMLMSNE